MSVSGSAAPLTVRLFGPLEACRNGAPIPHLRSRKGQWLLALLALRGGCEVERVWLAGALWPDSQERQTRASLRRSLTDLRQALGPEADRLRSPTPSTLCLDVAGAEIDVLAFDQAIACGDAPALEQAVALYRGPLLEGCVEAWAFQERQAREQAYLTALERLAEQALAGGDAVSAERHLRRAVAVDPLRETAQTPLMQALAGAGDYAAALHTYRELRLLLHREINAEPDVETTTLFQQLRAEARGAAEASGVRRQALDRPDPRQNRASGAKIAASSASRLGTLPHPEGVRPGADGPDASTLTFLFTDIEGHTWLWEQHPEEMPAALARHDAHIRQAIEAHGGHVFKTVGDQFCAAFAVAPEALAAALAAQQALHAEPWPPTRPLRVRMALHTGAVEQREDDYFGLPSIGSLGCWRPAGADRSCFRWPPRSWPAMPCRREPRCAIWASTA